MPDAAPSPDQTRVIYTSAVSVRAADTGKTDEELLALIKAKAPDPSVFDDKAPFVWRVQASSSRRDSYHTKMHPSSLKNYAKDAKDGVMFLDSHVKRQLGYGQSVFGEYIEGDIEDDKKPAVMMADFFTIPGIRLNAVDTDSFIEAVRSGVIRDVSIGFIPGTFECSICKGDPYDWWSMECMHIPGAFYDKTGKEITSKSKGGTQAFAWVKDARLSEVSAVFDGATPGAHVEKAKYLVDRGVLSRSSAVMVERQLSVRLPTAPILVPTFAVKDGKLTLEAGEAIVDGQRLTPGTEVPMGKEFRRLAAQNREQPESDPPTTPQENAAETETETPPAPEPVENDAPANEQSSETEGENAMTEEEIRALTQRAEKAESTLAAITVAARAAAGSDATDTDPLAVINAQRARITELTPLADMGRRYREQTIKDALEEGVRAYGTDWSVETYREMLEGLNIEHIERLRDDWKKQAAATIPAGGRKTADTGTEPAGAGAKRNGSAPLAQFSTR